MAKVPDKIQVLSQSDVDFLRQLRRDFRNKIYNRRVHSQTEPLGEFPDVYVARVQGGTGITALSSATCDIYKIQTGSPTQIPNFSKSVFNVSNVDIPAEVVEPPNVDPTPVYFRVVRDKFGIWLAEAAPEATTQQIERIWVKFSLTSYWVSNQATASVIASRGTNAPPVSSVITVEDLDDLFNDSDVGCVGYAINWGTAAVPEYRVLLIERVVKEIWATASGQILPTDADVNAKVTSPLFISSQDCTFAPAIGDCNLINEMKHCATGGDTGQSIPAETILFKRKRNIKVGGKWVFEIEDVTHHEVMVPDTLEVFDDTAQGAKTLRWKGKKGSIELFDLDSDFEELFVLQLKSVLTGGSYNTTSHKLVGTREKIYVFGSEADTDVDLMTMVEKKLVRSNDVSGLNIRYIAASIWVPEAAADDAATTFHTGTNVCPPLS